jgi:hypothetical protein
MAHMANAARHLTGEQQLGFSDTATREARARIAPRRPVWQPRVCTGCGAAEARYGFRIDGDPLAVRPRTLCFGCFSTELERRRRLVAARLARDWNARQVPLPLEDRLRTLSLRRRRSQIAARKALGL